MPSIFFACGKNNFSQACFVYLRLSLHNTMMKKQPWIGFPWTSTSLNKVIAKNQYFEIGNYQIDSCHPRATDKKVSQLLVWVLICKFQSLIGKNIPASFTDKEVFQLWQWQLGQVGFDRSKLNAFAKAKKLFVSETGIRFCAKDSRISFLALAIASKKNIQNCQ